MKLRSRHLVLLLLLVSTAHFAEGSGSSAGGVELRSRYRCELLSRLAPSAPWGRSAAGAERFDRTDAIEVLALPSAALVVMRAVWTMTEPAAQAVAVTAATGRGLRLDLANSLR